MRGGALKIVLGVTVAIREPIPALEFCTAWTKMPSELLCDSVMARIGIFPNRSAPRPGRGMDGRDWRKLPPCDLDQKVEIYYVFRSGVPR